MPNVTKDARLRSRHFMIRGDQDELIRELARRTGDDFSTIVRHALDFGLAAEQADLRKRGVPQARDNGEASD